MAIPDLTPDGILPTGIHDCTLEEVGERFGRFCSSDRRVRLFKSLCEYVGELQQTGLASTVLVDGSFVTAKEAPEDVDMVVVLREGHDFSQQLRPFEYNALSARMIRRTYGLDAFPVPHGSGAGAHLVDLFQQVRGCPGVTKGILKVEMQ